jgi:uncharacterized protein
MRCAQLTADNRCRLFGSAERPPVCKNLRPNEEMCGVTDADAMERLTAWERLTRPDVEHSG